MCCFKNLKVKKQLKFDENGEITLYKLIGVTNEKVYSIHGDYAWQPGVNKARFGSIAKFFRFFYKKYYSFSSPSGIHVYLDEYEAEECSFAGVIVKATCKKEHFITAGYSSLSWDIEAQVVFSEIIIPQKEWDTKIKPLLLPN